MEGVQSYEQRSLSGLEGSAGNRVIIVNRREPNLSWPWAVSGVVGDISASKAYCCGLFSYFRYLKPLVSKFNCCQRNDSSEKSITRNRAKRKVGGSLSFDSSISSTSPTTGASFDFGPFASNKWTTSKYTLLNFLPRNLFEQFRRLANFYFLVTAIIQIMIPHSPVGPSTSLIPLVFVVSTTAIKQAYEDYLRHKLDNEVNNRVCYVLKENNKLVRVTSKEIRVGDIVYVKNNEEVPCDMILLCSSGNSGDRCYITTANLDGETSLKSRTCFSIKSKIGSLDKVNETLLVVECERPNATLYEFNGFLRAPKDTAAYESLISDLKHFDEFKTNDKQLGGGGGGATVSSVNSNSSSAMRSKRLAIISTIYNRIRQTSFKSKLTKHLTHEQLKQIGADRLIEPRPEHIEIPLDISNLLLRASRLRNTSFIYGLAIYTGPDTRLAHNSHVKPNKFSSLESRVNTFLLIAFIMLLLLTLVSSLHHMQTQSSSKEVTEQTTDKSNSTFLEILMAHFVLYNYLVPISLYVTLEFVKFLGTISVLEDKKLQATVWTTVTKDQEQHHNLKNEVTTSSRQQQLSDSKVTQSQSGTKQVKRLVGPQCNSSDLNEDLGQVEVLFSDKTGTLTENKMHFMACSISGRLFRSINEHLYEQPEGLCHIPTLRVARKLASVGANRYAAISGELSAQHGPRSAPQSAGSSRSSKSSLDRLFKLPANKRPFDHRFVPPLSDLNRVDALENRQQVVEFFLCLCLCSTLTLNEQTPLNECTPQHTIDYRRQDYQSASPDEESLISAAAQFGITMFKSSERECFIAIRRATTSPSVDNQAQHTSSASSLSSGGKKSNQHFKPVIETKHSNDKFIVRHFQRLTTFEFNSIRKKMSVLFRDCDNDCYLLVTKGSESVLDCIGLTSKHSPIAIEHLLDSTLAHFEAFSKSGLRTMLVAKKILDSSTHEHIQGELNEIRLLASQEQREQRLTQLYKQVECDMSLVGATAVEDSLQEGVPETIANLKEAGIKVWLLTGDKVETAISVAYLCKLLDRNMNMLQLVRQQDSDTCKDLLGVFAKKIRSALILGDDEFDVAEHQLIEQNNDFNQHSSSQQRQSLSKRPKSFALKSLVVQHQQQKSTMTKRASRKNELDLPRFALIADGRSLHYAMKYAKEELKFVCTHCDCVLGCRLSPLQKAEVVEMIKGTEQSPITAAIGDGANDVSMIQEAHVGIGISGKEGRQAVNSSDFAINRFHMLGRLFFVHGHLFYHRTATTIHYFFYKNVLFIVPQFLYSFYTLSSGSSLYHPLMLITYNMIFTSAPILLYGLFEININEILLETYPRLYRLNMRNRKMKYITFVSWIGMGVLQAIIAFYFIRIIHDSSTTLRDDTSKPTTSPLTYSTILFFSLVLTTTLKLYFISHRHSLSLHLASIISCSMLPVTFYLASLIDLSHLFDDNSLYGHYHVLLRSPTYWLAIFGTTLATAIPDILLYMAEQLSYYRIINSVID